MTSSAPLSAPLFSASSCSRKKGFPSAASTMRRRSSAARSRSGLRCSASANRLVVGEGCQHGENGVRSRRRPRRPFLEELGPCQAQDDNPRPARETRDVLQQVEQRRLGPVDVVDDEDERSLACKRLEESSKRPGGLFAGTADRVRSERAGNAVRDRLSTLVVRHQLENGCACIRAEDGPERLRERQECDAFPVRGAAPDQHADRVAELGPGTPAPAVTSRPRRRPPRSRGRTRCSRWRDEEHPAGCRGR